MHSSESKFGPRHGPADLEPLRLAGRNTSAAQLARASQRGACALGAITTPRARVVARPPGRPGGASVMAYAPVDLRERVGQGEDGVGPPCERGDDEAAKTGGAPALR
jgi:hypothetical protein